MAPNYQDFIIIDATSDGKSISESFASSSKDNIICTTALTRLTYFVPDIQRLEYKMMGISCDGSLLASLKTT